MGGVDHMNQRTRRTGQTLGIIDGKAYGAANIYVIRSTTTTTTGDDHRHPHDYHFQSSARTYNNNDYRHDQAAAASKPAANDGALPTPHYYKSSSSATVMTPWIDYRQLKRRKRIAKYKLYAYEGKVKNSLKNGIRWIKRTCRKIVHGF